MSAMHRCAPLMLFSSLLLASVGCASHEDAKPQTTSTKPDEPKPEPEPKPSSADQVEVSVASVQLLQDCPDPEPAAAKPSPAQAKRRAPSDEEIAAGDAPEGFAPRMDCTQSTLQLAFTSKAQQAVPIEINEIRIRLASGGETLSTIEARAPTVWTDSKYEPWDESVSAGASVKASYKIGTPDWGAVEKALGKSSFGPTYVLEIDVAVDGVERTRTIESAKVPREEPAQVVT